jgi:hypothetical protein
MHAETWQAWMLADDLADAATAFALGFSIFYR